MTWIILTVLLALVEVAAVLIVRRTRPRGAARGTEPLAVVPTDRAARIRREASGGVWISSTVMGALAALLWVALTLGSTLHIVSAGHVGIVWTFGKVTGQTPAGFQVTAPWQNFTIENVQVQRWSNDAKSPIVGFTKETQDVFILATVNYSVSPNAVRSLITDVGSDWFDKLVVPRVENYLKEETVQYAAVDIAPNRETIRTDVRDRLRSDLKQYSIDVNDLLLDNVDFSDQFKKAIEDKQQAIQNAQAEENKIAIAQAQAQQKIEAAKGEAEATRQLAQGQADANRSINESLTPAVLQYLAIQKFAGNVSIALVPSGSGLLIDPSQLVGQLLPAPTPTPAP